MSEQKDAFDWRIVAYVLAGLTLLFLIASLAGSGTGLFGWGVMMGAMWVWVLLVIVALVGFGYFLGQQKQQEK